MKALIAFLLLTIPSVVAIQADPDQRFAQVERAIEDSMESHGVLGLSIAIIDDSEVVYARGFGLAEPGPSG